MAILSHLGPTSKLLGAGPFTLPAVIWRQWVVAGTYGRYLDAFFDNWRPDRGRRMEMNSPAPPLLFDYLGSNKGPRAGLPHLGGGHFYEGDAGLTGVRLAPPRSALMSFLRASRP